MTEIEKVTKEYRAKFDEWPPTWGYLIKDAVKQMEKAIRTGEEMEGAEAFYNLPDNIVL